MIFKKYGYLEIMHVCALVYLLYNGIIIYIYKLFYSIVYSIYNSILLLSNRVIYAHTCMILHYSHFWDKR